MPDHSKVWLGEKGFALLAAIVCLVITVSVWPVGAHRQPLWVFPALYLIEMLALSAIVAVATVYGISASGMLSWMAAGAVLAFCVVGLFSAGLFYVPVAVLLAVVGTLTAWRTRKNILICVAWAVIAALAQFGIAYLTIILHV